MYRVTFYDQKKGRYRHEEISGDDVLAVFGDLSLTPGDRTLAIAPDGRRMWVSRKP